jgi:succinoglycan biosynthesis transport protein ExoP
MEDEFDLRGYVEILLRGWKWIIGAGVVAGLAALVVSFLMPPTYEATSLVIITEPRYQMQLDERFETAEGLLVEYEVFPTLAVSDDVLDEVLNRCMPSDMDPETWTLHALSAMVQATSKGDPSLVVLGAESGSASDAAAIANTWAEVLAERANDIYGEGDDEVQFFSAQVAGAQQALDEAEAALIEFQGRNQTSILQAELDSCVRTRTDYLADQRSIAYLLQDIEGLRNQLAEQPPGSVSSLADDLTTLFLQIKAFNAGASAPIELQVASAESLSSRSLSEQIGFLDGLVVTLEAKSAEIEDRLGLLVAPILELQGDLEEIDAEQESLARDIELASERYLVLARKLQEAQLAASEPQGVAQVGSYAAVPTYPAGPRIALNTAGAAVGGLLVGAFGILAISWWTAGRDARGGVKGESDKCG